MKIIIHGGFFSESDQSLEVKIAKQNSLKEIAKTSFEFLKTNSAEETVVYAVKMLEDDLLYNAGMGSQIQSDGKIRMRNVPSFVYSRFYKKAKGIPLTIEDTYFYHEGRLAQLVDEIKL